MRFGSFDNVRVREAGDEVIIEGDGHHRRTVDGTPVEIRCVWFITRRHGQVTHFRDYMNPLTLSLAPPRRSTAGQLGPASPWSLHRDPGNQ